MRETQMKEAKQQMKEKAKELAKARSATGKSRLGGAMAVSFFRFHDLAYNMPHILHVHKLDHFIKMILGHWWWWQCPWWHVFCVWFRIIGCIANS